MPDKRSRETANGATGYHIGFLANDSELLLGSRLANPYVADFGISENHRSIMPRDGEFISSAITVARARAVMIAEIPSIRFVEASRGGFAGFTLSAPSESSAKHEAFQLRIGLLQCSSFLLA